MTVSKRLTSKSGLTIPKQLRTELGYRPGMAVDMVTTDKGVLIRPHSRVCRFCGRPEEVVHVADIDVCRACARALAAEVDSHD